MSEGFGREDAEEIREARVWAEGGWRAEVIKNEEDEGWAVAMFKTGESEPRLVGPWTMGRDKKNPKPLDKGAFTTLVKTANEFVGRLEQQQRARLHKEITVGFAPNRIFVHLDIDADEFEPSAKLSAFDEAGEELGSQKVEAEFRLTASSAEEWVDSGFEKARSS